MLENIICPNCGRTMHEISLDNAQGRRWYMECFDCGYCSEEKYDEGFDFNDPDEEL